MPRTTWGGPSVTVSHRGMNREQADFRGVRCVKRRDTFRLCDPSRGLVFGLATAFQRCGRNYPPGRNLEQWRQHSDSIVFGGCCLRSSDGNGHRHGASNPGHRTGSARCFGGRKCKRDGHVYIGNHLRGDFEHHLRSYRFSHGCAKPAHVRYVSNQCADLFGRHGNQRPHGQNNRSINSLYAGAARREPMEARRWRRGACVAVHGRNFVTAEALGLDAGAGCHFPGCSRDGLRRK